MPTPSPSKPTTGAGSTSSVKHRTLQHQAEASLNVFLYEGLTRTGVAIKGEIAARTDGLARAELRKQGVTIKKMRPRPRNLFGKPGKKIKPGDIAMLSRQVATMMQSGVPLVQSLDIMAMGQKNPRMTKMLEDVRNALGSGLSLSESLGRHPLLFDELYRNLVSAGEAAGVLDTVLDTVATYKERIESLKGKIKKALYYPASIIAVALLVSSILLIFVIPQFNSLFTGFGANLPAFTQMLVNLSTFMVHNWWKMLIGLVAGVMGFMAAHKRSVRLQHGVDKLLLRLPIIGMILRKSALSRFARTMAITFAAGVPLVEAMDTVAGATGSETYRAAVLKAKAEVAVGTPLNAALSHTGVFPHMVVQMIGIGEESGALDKMLIKVAEFYEEEVSNAVDSLSSLLEPFIMVIIGTLVGAMVIGMYLPIFKMASVIKG